MSSPNWQDIASERKRKQEDLIPPEWRIPSLSDDVLDVTPIPRTCGLLTGRELDITETTDVNLILSKLADGIWSAVEVTKAFYKRAIIAHQLVRTSSSRAWIRP